MARLFLSKTRVYLPWGIFAVAALGLALTLLHLYRTAEAEIGEQAEKTVSQTRAVLADQNRRYLAEAQRSVLVDLVGFHREGLETALQQWDAANEIVIATFIASPEGKFEWVSGEPKEDTIRPRVMALRQEFESWRKSHPSVVARDPAAVENGTVMAFATRRNPLFDEEDFRYQEENLASLKEQGDTPDPWCVWFADGENPEAPWMFWYRAGPHQPLRGCLISRSLLVDQLRQSLAPSAAAEVQLVRGVTTPADANRDGLSLLPGYRLDVHAGSLFTQKWKDARLTALLGLLVLLLFIGVGLQLAHATRKQRREAAEKLTFVAQVSHELRTPLTSLRMFGDLLMQDGLSEEKRVRYATQVANESQRLGALIERLLSFNALARNGGPLAVEDFDLSALVRDVAETSQPRALDAGKQLQTEGVAEVVTVQGDRSVTKQALLNLLENACRHSGAGNNISIQLMVTDKAVLRVSDNGPGLPASVKARLFEPFVQGGNRLTDKTPGLGLGLSLSRGWLRRAGAELLHVNTPEGACFEVQLPLAPLPHAQISPHAGDTP